MSKIDHNIPLTDDELKAVEEAGAAWCGETTFSRLFATLRAEHTKSRELEFELRRLQSPLARREGDDVSDERQLEEIQRVRERYADRQPDLIDELWGVLTPDCGPERWHKLVEWVAKNPNVQADLSATRTRLEEYERLGWEIASIEGMTSFDRIRSIIRRVDKEFRRLRGEPAVGGEGQ